MQTAKKNETPSKTESYSDAYITIRKAAEESWPEWKRTSYNVNFATSAHAKKIVSKF